jgi:site-specific recombinase XerD
VTGQPGVVKRVGCHTLRRFFAAHLLEAGSYIRTIEDLPGHRDLGTTMHTRALNKGGGVRSPVDGLKAGLYSLYGHC